MITIVAVSLSIAAQAGAQFSASAGVQDGAAGGLAGLPGVVIAYSPPASNIFVGSPGIVRLADGTLLAKWDEFGPASTEHQSAVTRVHRSTDDGKTWEALAKVEGLFWASIFEHNGAVYMIGVQHHHGPLVIVRSDDSGKTWTRPTDAKHGLIRDGIFHTAPTAIIEHDGRLWRSIEDGNGPKGWGQMYRPRVMSIPTDGDLLDAAQWTVTEPIPRDGGWLGGRFWCVLEGNIVFDRKSEKIRNILRTDKRELAAVVTVGDAGKTIAIDPDFDSMPFVGGTDKKFMIRWDEPSQQYYALGNVIAPADVVNGISDSGGTRNTLALYRSADLRTWTLCSVLLHHPDRKHHGFQYPDWITEGDDLLVVSRTAFDSPGGLPNRQHDANYLTFHRFKNFRKLTPADGIALPAAEAKVGVSQKIGQLRVSGDGFEFTKLADSEKAFRNRDYTWQNVPAGFADAVVTRGDGGVAAKIEIESEADATIYVVTGGDMIGVDLSAFTAVEKTEFNYSDGGKTSLRVYSRTVKAGERVTLPTGNWAGVNLVVPVEK